MSVAAMQGNTLAMICGILAMVVLIVFLDYFLWKPLVTWSQKFRVEETSPTTSSDSLFFQVIAHSFLIHKLRQAIHILVEKKRQIPKRILPMLAVSRICLFILLALIATGLVFLFGAIGKVSFEQWLHLAHMTLLTLGRVVCCVVIGTLIALPLGLMIGLSEKLSIKLEPVIQIAASFPATLLFPVLILLFHYAGISLNIGSIILMLLGTQQYILFNVIAGAKAMPSDLKEAATAFRWKKTQRFFRFYIPAVFPYLITGLVTSAGGAWGTSIVAEYVSFKDQILTIPGIGSTISLSAQNGDIPLLAASIVVMSAVVAILNYQGWLRLYHYSEKRFSLNY